MDAAKDKPEDGSPEGGPINASARTGDRPLSLEAYLEILDIFKDCLGGLDGKAKSGTLATLEIVSEVLNKDSDLVFRFLKLTRGHEKYQDADHVMTVFLDEFTERKVLEALIIGLETGLI